MLRLSECFASKRLGLGKLGCKCLGCIDSAALRQPINHRFRVLTQNESLPEFEFGPASNQLVNDSVERTAEHFSGSWVNFADQDVPMRIMGIWGGAWLFVFYNNRPRYIEIEFFGYQRHHLPHLRPGGGLLRGHDPMSDRICRALR